MKKQTTYKYKNIIIETRSYKLVVSKRWKPKAILKDNRKSEIIETPLIWEKEFNTKEEANNYAVRQSKMFIEKNK